MPCIRADGKLRGEFSTTYSSLRQKNSALRLRFVARAPGAQHAIASGAPVEMLLPAWCGDTDGPLCELCPEAQQTRLPLSPCAAAVPLGPFVARTLTGRTWAFRGVYETLPPVCAGSGRSRPEEPARLCRTEEHPYFGCRQNRFGLQRRLNPRTVGLQGRPMLVAGPRSGSEGGVRPGLVCGPAALQFMTAEASLARPPPMERAWRPAMSHFAAPSRLRPYTYAPSRYGPKLRRLHALRDLRSRLVVYPTRGIGLVLLFASRPSRMTSD